MAQEVKTFKVEDARIIFRNFAGKEGQYNREGDRNFAVILEDDVATTLLSDGWNVKYLESREEGELPTPYMTITVRFDPRPPRGVMLTSRSRVNLTEENVEILDYADIAVVDMIVRAYEWTVNGKSGIKAYLQSIFVTIEEDDLERKYAINEVEA